MSKPKVAVSLLVGVLVLVVFSLASFGMGFFKGVESREPKWDVCRETKQTLLTDVWLNHDQWAAVQGPVESLGRTTDRYLSTAREEPGWCEQVSPNYARSDELGIHNFVLNRYISNDAAISGFRRATEDASEADKQGGGSGDVGRDPEIEAPWGLVTRFECLVVTVRTVPIDEETKPLADQSIENAHEFAASLASRVCASD